MTSSVVIWPIIKALCIASQFAGVNPVGWQAVNPVQQLFLDNHFVKRNELAAFTDKELRAWASRDYQELNAILTRENFNIQLEPFESPDSFGVVSIFDVQVEWLHEGEKTGFRNENHDETIYPAVRMEKGLTVYCMDNYTQPIVCIKTKSQDKVFMTIAEHDTPLQDFDLLQWIATVKNNRVLSEQYYDSVEFPMVDLDQKVDISWLLEMWVPDLHFSDGAYWYIAQALQQTKFKMNEVGAHVESAAAVEVGWCTSGWTNDIRINKPFYLWIERSGVTDPIFAGYITEQDWKEPKTLKNALKKTRKIKKLKFVT